MKTRLLLLPMLFSFLSAEAQPQQASYVITDVLEICYCSDGSGNGAEFTFTGVIPGESITVVFCSGNMSPNNVMRGYTGVFLDNPIPGLTGSFSNLNGVSGTGEVGTGIRLEFEEEISSSNCLNGVLDPFRFFVIPGDAPVWPGPDNCIGTTEGIGCSMTSVVVLNDTPEFLTTVIDDHIRIEQRGGADANVGVELTDVNGRQVLTTSVRLRNGQRIELPMPDVVSGTYVLTCTTDHRTLTQRLTVVR